MINLWNILINFSNSSNKCVTLNLINLSKLFHIIMLFDKLIKCDLGNSSKLIWYICHTYLINMSILFDKFVKLLTQAVRVVFRLAIMLCVSFPPFTQVFCACCENHGYVQNINDDYVIISLRRIKKPFFLGVFALFFNVRNSPS